MSKLTLVLALLALGAFGLAACGDDDEEETTPAQTTPEETTEKTTPKTGPTGGKPETVGVSAAPGGSLAFQEDDLSVPAGEVTFEFENPAQIVHDFCIENQDGNEVGCTDQITDSEDSLTADLKPGKYEFYCSVAGHREGGMEGPLTVR